MVLKMKKIIFLITLGLSTTLTFSQKVGTLELNNGESVDLYEKTTKRFVNKVEYHGQTIYYYTEDGKKKSIKHSKVKNMISGVDLYLSLPIYVFKAKRLHRVVAENEKYLLTDYYSVNRYQFYIFDKKSMNAVEKLRFQTYMPEKDIKLIGVIEKYFSDCPELINKIQSNFDLFYNDDYDIRTSPRPSVLFMGISQFKCND